MGHPGNSNLAGTGNGAGKRQATPSPTAFRKLAKNSSGQLLGGAGDQTLAELAELAADLAPDVITSKLPPSLSVTPTVAPPWQSRRLRLALAARSGALGGSRSLSVTLP